MIKNIIFINEKNIYKKNKYQSFKKIYSLLKLAQS